MHMRVSRAFLRLCETLGCSIPQGGTSAGRVLLWLFDHYEAVRVAAGFAPLAPVEGTDSKVMARLRMANSTMTLLQFSRTRATNWRQKRALRLALEKIDLLGDRAA
jgi:hypothetical protein